MARQFGKELRHAVERALEFVAVPTLCGFVWRLHLELDLVGHPVGHLLDRLRTALLRVDLAVFLALTFLQADRQFACLEWNVETPLFQVFLTIAQRDGLHELIAVGALDVFGSHE